MSRAKKDRADPHTEKNTHLASRLTHIRGCSFKLQYPRHVKAKGYRTSLSGILRPSDRTRTAAWARQFPDDSTCSRVTSGASSRSSMTLTQFPGSKGDRRQAVRLLLVTDRGKNTKPLSSPSPSRNTLYGGKHCSYCNAVRYGGICCSPCSRRAIITTVDVTDSSSRKPLLRRRLS